MGHTLWIHFASPSAGSTGWVPSLLSVLKHTISVAENHSLDLTPHDIVIGLAVYDPKTLGRADSCFEFIELTERNGDGCEWPSVVKAFFASDGHGFAENKRFCSLKGGRRAELHLRIRDKSPTPMIISTTHSFSTFANMKRFDLDQKTNGFKPDPKAANDVHFGIKWKAVALPEDIILAFSFLEAFASLSCDSERLPKIHSEVHGELGWELQLRSGPSVSERWQWAWKHANHGAVLNSFPSLPLEQNNVLVLLPNQLFLQLDTPKSLVRRFGIDIDASKITCFMADDEDPLSDNFKQHRIGPLLLDDAVKTLFGPKAVKSRHKLLRKVRFDSSYRVCNGCGAPENPSTTPLQLCSRCKDALYCSRDCQMGDWPEHKRSCSKNEKVYFKLEAGYPNDIESLRFAPAMKSEKPLHEIVVYITKVSSQIYHRTLRDRSPNTFSGPVVIPAINLYSKNRRGRYVIACPPWTLRPNITVDMMDDYLKQCAEAAKHMKPNGDIELASCFWHSGGHLYQQVYRCSDECNVVIRCKIKKGTGHLSNEWVESSVAPLIDVRRIVLLFKETY